MPPALRSLIVDETAGVTFINIGKWESWRAFKAHFADQLAREEAFDREIETAPCHQFLKTIRNRSDDLLRIWLGV